MFYMSLDELQSEETKTRETEKDRILREVRNVDNYFDMLKTNVRWLGTKIQESSISSPFFSARFDEINCYLKKAEVAAGEIKESVENGYID